MTYEEGVAVLGLAPGTDAKAARKAYLRLVKVHSPERDPEGFMRVREAYEAVEKRARYAPATASAQVADPPASTEPPLPSPSAHAPEPWEAQAAEAFTELRQRIWIADDPEEAIELARNAVDRFRTAQAYELLAEQLEQAGREQEATAVMRRARDEGVIDAAALETLSPAALTDDELLAWSERARTEPTTGWSQLASELLRRGLHAEAARAVSLAVIASRSDPLAFPINAWESTDMALKLIEHAQPGAALELISGQSAGHGAGTTPAVRTELVRELAHVTSQLSTGMASAFARAIRSYDPQDAELDVAAYARQNEQQARVALKRLKRDAPLLLQCYGAALGAPPPWRVRFAGLFSGGGGDSGGGGPGVWLMYLVIMASIRLVSQSFCNEPPRAPSAAALVTQSARPNLSVLCVGIEDQALCESARDLLNARTCADKREPATRLGQEYERMQDDGTLRDRHEEALQAIVSFASAECTDLFRGSAQ